MANDLKLQVLLSAIDRVTAPLRKIMSGSSSTAKALKATRDQLRELDRAQRQVQGFRTLSSQAQQSSVAMRSAYQRLEQLRAGMAGVENPTQKAANALAKAEREAVKLKNAHIGNLRALKESKAELASAGISINQLGAHERRLRTEIERTTATITKQQAKLERLALVNQRMAAARNRLSQSQSMASRLSSGGASLGVGAAVAAAPVLATVKAYASFEDAMLGVARQVNGAKTSTGQLTPLYFEMADSIKRMATRIPMATTEIAALVEAGARMGIQGKKNLIAFAETTATTAAAFDLPVDQVGDNMGKLANLYKIPIPSISKLGDVINYLDDNTLAKGGDIIDVMQRMGGVADKLDFKKAAALGSSFLTLGAAPEVAASAANAMVRELSIAGMQGKRFQKGIKTLGLDAQKLQKSMTIDATGTIISVLEQIKRLKPEQQMTVATQLFGKEFGDDAAKLANNLDTYRQALELVNAEQAKGSMNREAQSRLRNLSAGWQLLKNKAFNAAATLGATLAPAIGDVMKRAGALLERVSEWVKANPHLAGTLLKVAAGVAVLLGGLSGLALGVSGVLGPFALMRYSATVLGIQMGPLATGIRALGSKAFPMLLTGARALLPVLGGVSAPVLAIVAAVAVAALLIWKYWQPIKAFMVGLWQGISEAMAPIGAELAQAFAPLRPVFDWLGQALGKVWGWIRQLLTPFQATNAELQNATNYGRTFGQILGTAIAAPIRLVIAGVSLLYRWLRIAFEYSPIGLITRNWQAILGFLGGLWTRFRDIGSHLMQGLIGGLLGGLKAVGETVSNIGGRVVGWMREKLGIHSPSRVFAQLGDYTMQGLAGGLNRSQGHPLRALSSIAGSMRQVGAGVALGAAALPAVAIDNRAPIAPTSSAAAAAGATYNITINAGPGAAAQDIASMVRAELERFEREKAARTRSRLGDYGN